MLSKAAKVFQYIFSLPNLFPWLKIMIPSAPCMSSMLTVFEHVFTLTYKLYKRRPIVMA